MWITFDLKHVKRNGANSNFKRNKTLRNWVIYQQLINRVNRAMIVLKRHDFSELSSITTQKILLQEFGSYDFKKSSIVSMHQHLAILSILLNILMI